MDRPPPSPRATLSAASWASFAVPLVLGLGLDLLSKEIAFRRLVIDWVPDSRGLMHVDSRVYEFIPNYLHFQAHVNYGAVFGIGQGARTFFIIVSVFAIALLISLFARSGRQWFYQVLLGMLLAGVLGNMYDRIFFGFVRDMIYALPGWMWSDVYERLPDTDVFPWIFNIADSLLCTGVAGMFIYTLFRRDEPAEVTDAPPAVSASAPEKESLR